MVMVQKVFWLVVSTHLKNIGQTGNLSQMGVKIKKYLKPPPSFSGDLMILMMVYSDAWNKFQKYYPKWWRKMVIYYCRIRKASPENKQYPLFPLIFSSNIGFNLVMNSTIES